MVTAIPNPKQMGYIFTFSPQTREKVDGCVLEYVRNGKTNNDREKQTCLSCCIYNDRELQLLLQIQTLYTVFYTF